jgi:signal peptidase II
MTTEAPVPAVGAPKLAAVTANGWLAFAAALAVLMLDQVSKAWILYGLQLRPGESIRLLPVLNLTGVQNIGVTFGMLRADSALTRGLLSLFALCVVTVLGFWARRAERRLTAVALGLIMGGAIGNNLIDVSGLGFFPWVFNLADAFIDIGIALLLVESLWPQRKPAP